MTNLELSLKDELLDIFQNEKIALNYEVNTIGELSTRQGFSSNDFEIPATAKNKKRLSFNDNINSNNTFPYQKQNAVLRQNSIEILRGFIQVISYDRKKQTFKISLFGGNVDWFELVKNISLQVLDFREYDHFLLASEIVDSFTNTEGYIYPLIDYGRLTTNLYADTEVIDWLPSVFYHTILKKIFDRIYYKVAGSFLQNPRFKKQILAYSKDELPEANRNYIDERNINVQKTTVVVYDPATPALVDYVFDTVNYQNINSYNTGTGIFTFAQNGKVNFEVRFLGITIENIIPAKRDFYIQIWDDTNNIEVAKSNSIQITGLPIENISYNYEYTFEKIEVSELIDYKIRVYASTLFGFVNDLTIQEGYCNVIWSNEFNEGIPISLSNILPDKTASEFLIELANQYALVFQVDTDTQTVEIFQFDDIEKNIINAIDWSDKLAQSENQDIDFVEFVQNYGQVSWLVMNTSDDDFYLNQYKTLYLENLGSGFISIGNAFIEREKDVFESDFAGTFNIDSFGGNAYIPYIPIWEADNEGIFEANFNPELRYLFVEQEVSLQYFCNFDSILIDGGLGYENITHAPFAWFYKKTLDNYLDSLDWNGGYSVPKGQTNQSDTNLDLSYKSLTKILQKPIMIELYFKLSATDINNLDFKKPIFVGYPYQAYFTLNKIVEYTGNGVTKCELVKLQ
jgi:hypothetical protein